MGKTIVKMFKGNNRYKDENAVENLVNYVYDHPEDNLIDAINISSDRDMAVMQMKKLKKLQRNTEGRQAVHSIVSNWMFSRITAGNLLSIGRRIAAIFQNKYQILLVVHAPTDGGSRHLHFTAYDSAECESDPVKLAEIVRDVNLTVVPEDEILSDHVYFYNHETENITIAA